MTCEGFPEREKGLSAYLSDIVEMATRFMGLTFYEYHSEFSAKSPTWHARWLSSIGLNETLCYSINCFQVSRLALVQFATA